MATKLADDPQSENARKQLAEEKQATEKTREEFLKRAKGKPTPTQEENDLAKLGAHILEHEEDGSDPDPNVKQSEANRPSGGGYQTRQATPAHQPHRASRSE